MSGRRFHVYFITLSVFRMDMTDASSFICYYDISAVALPKCVALSNISSGSFSNALNVMIFNFFCTKFAKDLDGVCLEVLVP